MLLHSYYRVVLRNNFALNWLKAWCFVNKIIFVCMKAALCFYIVLSVHGCLLPPCLIWGVRTRWGSWEELCPTPTSSLTRCATGTPPLKSSGWSHTDGHAFCHSWSAAWGLVVRFPTPAASICRSDVCQNNKSQCGWVYVQMVPSSNADVKPQMTR